MCTFSTRQRHREAARATEEWQRGFRAGFLSALLLIVVAAVLVCRVAQRS